MKSMDPSNFGSFSSGGNSGATGNSGVPNGGVAPGTNPAANPQQVNPVQTQGFGGAQQMGQVYQSTSVFQQPQPSQFQPQTVASGGDVVLDGGASRKKFLVKIISIGLLVLVICGILIYFIVNNITNDRAASNVSVSPVKESFNKYVNYVLSGEDNGKGVDKTFIESSVPYFESLDNTEKEKYVEIASQKFENFSELYYDELGGYSLEDIETYFEQYASINPFTENDIIIEYVAEGKERTQDTVNSLFNSIRLSDMNEKLDQYIDAEKLLAKTWLSIIINADEAGCVDTSEIVPGCYKVSNEEQSEIARLRDLINSLSFSMESKAKSSLSMIYGEIYGIENTGENQ